MYKRLVIKTTLICIGIFIVLSSAAIFVFNSKFELDTEKRIHVVVASKDIIAGEIIDESMVEYRTIKESAVTYNMMTSTDELVKAKALAPVKCGDYIFSYNLAPADSCQTEDGHTTVLPMTMDDRLANLIKTGSLINIKVLPADVKTIPKLVISHIRVTDMLDENGSSYDDVLGSKKAYAVVTLEKEQRDRLYAAMQIGKLMYELYCDSTQPKDKEDFVIPAGLLGDPLSEKVALPGNQDNSQSGGGAN